MVQYLYAASSRDEAYGQADGSETHSNYGPPETRHAPDCRGELFQFDLLARRHKCRQPIPVLPPLPASFAGPIDAGWTILPTILSLGVFPRAVLQRLLEPCVG